MLCRPLVVGALLCTGCRPNPPAPQFTQETGVAEDASADVAPEALSDAAAACTDLWEGTTDDSGSFAQWYSVRDRTVTRADGGSKTTYAPGTYPMLWVQSNKQKAYARYWLPSANAPKRPRAVTFTRCSSTPIGAPVPSSTRTLAMVRCDGAKPMLFAAIERADGTLGVVEADAAKPAWTNVEPDAHATVHVRCTSIKGDFDTYDRDVVGPGTFP